MRTELSLGTDPRMYGQLIFDKGGKAIQWGKNNLYNKWCENNCYPHAKKKNPQILPHTRYKNKLYMDPRRPKCES